MPTTLPDRASRAKPPYASVAPFLAALLYLLLLGWNVSALEADFTSIAPVNAADAYSPMELAAHTRP